MPPKHSPKKSPAKKSAAKKSAAKKPAAKKKATEKHVISKRQGDDLYRLIQVVHETFTKNQIEYWITGGTLLGSVRHGGIIPWDDDADVCIMKKDVGKLRKLKAAFRRKGYLLEEEAEDEYMCAKYKDTCSWAVSPVDEDDNLVGLSLDIFIMKKVKGGIITYANPVWEEADNGGVRCSFAAKNVFPLVPKSFGNFYVYVPNNAIEHLNTCYGDDWNSKSQVLFNHITGKWVNSEKQKMTSAEYAAMKPPADTCSHKVPKVMSKSCTK